MDWEQASGTLKNASNETVKETVTFERKRIT
jgi:hypothetical protein